MTYQFFLLLFVLFLCLICCFACIGFTLLYLKMTVIPLVPETKIADVGKLISLGNILARKTMLTTTSATSILSRIFGAYCMTRIVYKYSHFPTLIPFHIFTYKVNTLFPVWLPERTLSLSQFRLTESTHTSSFFYIWHPAINRHENVYSLQPFFSSLYFFGETFSSLDHRNVVKPQKETNNRNT